MVTFSAIIELLRAQLDSIMVSFPRLALTTLTLGGIFASAAPSSLESSTKRWYLSPEVDILSVTIRDLQAFLSNGTITSVQLTQRYLDNIANNNHAGLELRAVIETAPYANVMAIAQQMDDMRANGVSTFSWGCFVFAPLMVGIGFAQTILSELHGIPMLFKDNIATDVALGMNTTAGNFGFLGSSVPGDAPVAAKLRAKGVIVLGKASESERAR